MPEQASRLAGHVREQLARAIVGQADAMDQILVTILSGGHAVIEGVPGVAKTLAVKSLARICGVPFQRIQCTPDLMPADVSGTNIYNVSTGVFSLHRGPVFTDFLLVDEINRTPPRTQAALLEAMEERQVTIDGTRHPLSPSFTVFATQNPVEFEGTYPLPEAQLDRFLMKIRMNYPQSEHESTMLQRCHEGFDAHDLDRLDLRPIEPGLIEAARREVRSVRLDPTVLSYIIAIVRRTRDWPSLSLGASPRAGIFLMQTSKALAAIADRDYVIPDDVKHAAAPVLRHRLLLRPEADLENLTADQVVDQVLASVELPR